AAIGPEVSIGPLAKLLDAPAKPFARDGGGLDASVISRLFDGIATTLGGTAGAPVPLPLGLQLSVAGTDTVTISLATSAPIAGALDVSLALAVDRSFGVTPSGSIAFTVATGTELWPSVDVRLAVDASGISLVVTPAGSPPIQILPTFGGFGSLAGAA